MKENELKVTDLLVGDLVQIKEKDGTKLVGAFRVVAIGKTYLGGVISDFVRNGTISMSYIEDEKRVYQTEVCNIEPIALTPEILEKNGFEKIDNRYPFPTFVCDDKENMICLTIGFPEGDSTCRKSTFLEIDSVSAFVENIIINYVHQLQHALKLCGIDKEIVV